MDRSERLSRRPLRDSRGFAKRAGKQEDITLPWTTGNGISINYQLAGERGPLVVLMHEMGGTLDSWDAVAPGLAENYRVLRYDQRGSGLTEKVRQPYTNDTAVDDLEALLRNLNLGAPYTFVTVAAAATQALGFMQRHPAEVRSLVLCNPAPGVDPARAGALTERAALAERDGIRGVMAITLDKSYPPELTDRATYENYRGRYLANDPVNFGLAHRMLAGTNLTHLLPEIKVPTMVVAGRHDTVRPWAGSEDISKKIPGARFEVIEEAGHFLPTTGPKTLLKLLRDFLPR
jgi:3-oxoadipate enol-lactonase